MGISVNSAVVGAVKFNKKETSIFEKFMIGKPYYWLHMRWIEKMIEVEKSNKGTKWEGCLNPIYGYLKRGEKTGKITYPIRPFWHRRSKSDVEKMERRGFLIRQDTEDRMPFDLGKVWFPSDGSREGQKLLGIEMEGNYAREVDYALLDLLKLQDCEDFLYKVSGSRPWECGTTKIDSKNKKQEWYTCNGQHMLPRSNIPEDKVDDVYRKILSFTGPRNEFIKLKKQLWDLYGSGEKPYKVYAGEGWFGSNYNFYPVDILYQTVCELIPEIRYDVMRIEKYLCLYWS